MSKPQQAQIPGQRPEVNVQNKPRLADRWRGRFRRVDVDNITVLNPMATVERHTVDAHLAVLGVRNPKLLDEMFHRRCAVDSPLQWLAGAHELAQLAVNAELPVD